MNGITERNNVIIVMTTNHRGVLDEALIRKGRVDMEIEFKKAVLE